MFEKRNKMQNKICIIVVWFGKLPEYFRFWEISAAKNESYIDFLLVTDQEYISEYQNIHVLPMSIDVFKKRIHDSLELDVDFEKPFKACDFRPAYGIIFEDELAGYDYWGHCDLDQIFGDMGILVNRPDFDKYDKIGRSGHLTIYRNCSNINNLFRQNGALYDYRKVFITKENYAFDEKTGICRIATKQNIHYLNIVKMRADIRVRTRRLEIDGAENFEKQLFFWQNGHLYRSFMKDGRIQDEEYIYLHFQKKKLKSCEIHLGESFYIGKDGFSKKTCPVSEQDFDKYNKRDNAIFQCVETVKYYIRKIGDLAAVGKDQRKIWIAQKRIGNEKYE